VDGQLYRTVLTPSDLSDRAPHGFDIIYDLGARRNVAAAPGDPDYNGGAGGPRDLFNTSWRHRSCHDANGSGNLDSAEEVEGAGRSRPGGSSDQEVASFVIP
jgi:hypothetical protein